MEKVWTRGRSAASPSFDFVRAALEPLPELLIIRDDQTGCQGKSATRGGFHEPGGPAARWRGGWEPLPGQWRPGVDFRAEWWWNGSRTAGGRVREASRSCR